MTVPSTIDAAGWLRNYLESDDGDTDLVREMLATSAQALISDDERRNSTDTNNAGLKDGSAARFGDGQFVRAASDLA